ncbi:MAG: DUF6653 family protein [Halobacteriota archaeon]
MRAPDGIADRIDVAELEATFWERHSNPKSGWSRVALGFVLIAAIYRRDLRLLVATLLALALNPIAFAPPQAGQDSWMTRAVRAEQWWITGERGSFGTGWPNVLNTVNVPVFAYAVYAAYTRRPLRAAVSYGLAIALKFGWIEAIARRYDAAVQD